MSKSTKKAQPANVEKEGVNYDSIVSSHTFTFMNATFTGLDLANSAVKVESIRADLEGEKSTLGEKFIKFAMTCKSVAEFITLTTAVEAMKSWKSKQNPDGADTPPTVWQQYKSDVKIAWEKFGITPKQAKTMHTLKERLNAARKAAKEQKDHDSEGEASAKALEHAAEIDTSLASLIGAMSKVYDSLSSDSQRDMLSRMNELLADFTEVAELEAHLDEETETEETQAA